MVISVILAISRNGVIGKARALPWHLPDDLRNFRRLTLDKPVIMGRGTWESLPNPLPRRRCIVVASRPMDEVDCERAASPDAALALCRDAPEVMIIGGVRIYQHFLPLCDRLYLTEVDADIDGDRTLPELDRSQFALKQEQFHPPDERHAYPFRQLELERKRARC